MKKLMLLPIKLAALPLIILLLTLQLIGAFLVGLSSIVTRLLVAVFILGTVIGLAVSAPASMLCQTAGLGIFFAAAPHLAVRLMDKGSSLMLKLLDFALLR